jgi:uncharacterized protein (DUF427 family)
MAKAIWRGQVIAQSDDFELVEGNVYFPPTALRSEHLRPNDHHTVCSWKGTASYYDVVVGDAVAAAAAWYYPETLPAARHIQGYVAFWRGVTVEP